MNLKGLPLDNPPEPEKGSKTTRMMGSAKRITQIRKVYLIFLGSYWQKIGGANSTNSKVTNAIQEILDSDYVGKALKEYDIVAAPKLELPGISYADSDIAAIFKDNTAPGALAGSDPANSDIAAALTRMLSPRDAPSPALDADPEALYLVIMAPGVREASGALGEHRFFEFRPASGNPVRIHYAWVTGGPAGVPAKGDADWQKNFDFFTASLSHELLEALTDPNPDIGWTFGGYEICDMCNMSGSLPGGTRVSYYYSRTKRQCVGPA